MDTNLTTIIFDVTKKTITTHLKALIALINSVKMDHLGNIFITEIEVTANKTPSSPKRRIKNTQKNYSNQICQKISGKASIGEKKTKINVQNFQSKYN